MDYDIDLRVDLNCEDDTGLPWAFLRDAKDPRSSVRVRGWWSGRAKLRAVAQSLRSMENWCGCGLYPGRSINTVIFSLNAVQPDDRRVGH